MLKLAANLDWLFCERPIAGRFQAAKAAGFHGVEGLFLWQHPLDVLLAAQRETGLPVALMNAPAGNWQAGERGLASLPDRDEDDCPRLRYGVGLSQGARHGRTARGQPFRLRPTRTVDRPTAYRL